MMYLYTVVKRSICQKENRGFSKLSKAEKINWITQMFEEMPPRPRRFFLIQSQNEEKVQKLHDEFIENSITNYYFPLGVAPNFVINEDEYTIPMVTEESSVVAAACEVS